MKIRGFQTFSILALASFMSLAAGPCTPGTSLLCPEGSSDDGDGACASDATLTESLGIATALGTALPSFYYLGNNTGFVMGNTRYYSRYSSSADTLFAPDITASFAKGPLLTAGTITEAFTAVAVYSPTQAANASTNGYSAYDAITGVTSDLTGYIVAVGYALTSHGTVAGLIARYPPRGALDTTFNGTGYILGDSTVFTSGSFTMLKAVAIDSQGRVVVGGYGNAQPSFPSYLTYLETLTDGDPLLLQQSGDELQSILVRYLPDGTLDSSGFDTSTIESPASGSAVHGFATSPATGFMTTAAVGTRFDVINGVAIDEDDGIFAVGATALSHNPGPASTMAFIAHYSSAGELLTQQRGKDGAGAIFNDTYESFTAVAVDANGAAVAAGNTGSITVAAGPTMTVNSQVPLVARFILTEAGTDSEVLALDPSFNATTGFYVASATPALASDTVKALTLDEANDVYVLSGHALTAAGTETLLMTIGATSLAEASVTSPAAGHANSATILESFHGVALVTSGGTSRYMGVGYAFDQATALTHSLIASIFTPTSPTPLSLDTASFVKDPYTGAPANPFPTNLLPSFITSGTSWIPSSFPEFAAVAGSQLGHATMVYGGGLVEKFNAIAPSADGTHAIVVGYTTDSSAAPTTQRSFPILLIYRQDGNFVNPGDYSDFYTLQSAL
jgi:hypothetical protein